MKGMNATVFESRRAVSLLSPQSETADRSVRAPPVALPMKRGQNLWPEMVTQKWLTGAGGLPGCLKPDTDRALPKSEHGGDADRKRRRKQAIFLGSCEKSKLFSGEPLFGR